MFVFTYFKCFVNNGLFEMKEYENKSLLCDVG